jgi:hypothetical protein
MKAGQMIAMAVVATLQLAGLGCKDSSASGSSGEDFCTTAVGPDEACFTETFSGLWSDTSFPVDFPPNPHFYPATSATHNQAARLWQSGQLASIGIEIMAETGGTGPIEVEILALIGAN